MVFQTEVSDSQAKNSKQLSLALKYFRQTVLFFSYIIYIVICVPWYQLQ